MEYSDQALKFIAIGKENLIKNTMEKGASFSRMYFMHKGFKTDK